MTKDVRDRIILIALYLGMLASSMGAVGFFISFGTSMNPIFLLIGLALSVWAWVLGRTHTLLAVEVRQNKPVGKTRGLHAKGEGNHVK